MYNNHLCAYRASSQSYSWTQNTCIVVCFGYHPNCVDTYILCINMYRTSNRPTDELWRGPSPQSVFAYCYDDDILYQVDGNVRRFLRWHKWCYAVSYSSLAEKCLGSTVLLYFVTFIVDRFIAYISNYKRQKLRTCQPMLFVVWQLCST